MNTLLLPTGLMMIGAAGAWLWRRKPSWSAVFGAGAVCGGAAAGIILLAMQYFSGMGFAAKDFFVLPVLLLLLASGIHSVGYLSGHGSEHGGFYWCFFNLTGAAMLGVTQAETTLGFLLAWEIMGVASFALVIFDRHNENACRAGWIYMIACHGGAAFLILLFCFPHTPVWMFLLALAGFGLKIGLPLFHIWLPEAHPAAPAPVSALMSGAMIELGFFGLFSFGIISDKTCLPLYGWVLIVLGLIAAPCGIIFALAQNNLKKLLAYSSIENMGILSCAFGMGFLGAAYGISEMMICGFAGGAVHLLNHAFFKGGLFLGAGSVFKMTGTLEMDAMGGLLRRMPRTGTFFILNALGLCGLPPFAGFAGEFLIYSGAFAGLSSGISGIQVVSAAVLILLALTGGLAAAAFAKAAGAVFCGEPRSKHAAAAVDVPLFMHLPVLLLFALSCLLLLVLPEMLVYCALPFFPAEEELIMNLMSRTASVAMISFAVTVLTVAVMVIRMMLGRRKNCGERISMTWDCGYSRPDARMEYTGSSFSRTAEDFFALLLHPVRRIVRPEGIFPEKGEISGECEDGGIRFFWRPIANFTGWISEKIHFLQSGSLHFYLLTAVVTLIGMLLYAVWG